MHTTFSVTYFRISILGTSAKWLAVLEERGLKPSENTSLCIYGRECDLKSLK